MSTPMRMPHLIRDATGYRDNLYFSELEDSE